MSKTIRVLSLGAGVQSSTLALLYQLGKLTPAPEFAVFADTKAEPKAVYDWFKFLKTKINAFPIYTISQGDIVEDTFSKNIEVPLFTRRSDDEHAAALGEYRERVARIKKDNPDLWKAMLPPRPRKQGIIRRQCTGRYKIEAVYQQIRRVLGYAPRKRIKEHIDLVLGISTDEITRVKDSKKKWMTHKFPLIDDLDWSRQDCLNFWKEQGLPMPPKSSCWMCPLRDDQAWINMREQQPEEFAKAVDFDRRVRKLKPKYDLYLHRHGVPLDQVKFNPKDKTKMEDCDGLCDT